ncbi:non-ribosomal peptide synthetase, partial [Bacillus pseudomycoides]
GTLEKQLAYWKEQLSGELPVLNLPTDRPRAVKQTYQGSIERLVLSKQLTQKVRNLSKQEGTTLFMTLLAAFKTLLYRYTGQEDIIVGSPIANRNRSEIEGLVGFFVNTLPLRTKLSGDMTFREVLKLIRETSLEAYAHQDVPFEKLVEEIHPEREMGYSPLFNVMFVVQNDSTKIVKSSDVNLVPFEIQTETAKFDMTLCVHEDMEGFIVEIEYNTNLFVADTIKRMINHFNNLIQAFLENPNQSISTLSILTEEERYQLLTEWNNTEVSYQDNHCLHHLFEEQVIRTPENIAVVYKEKTLTYDELNKKANQLAHYLKMKGVGPDIPVGVRVERSLDLVISILGVLKAGGAYVPLDIDAPSARIAQILKDSKTKVCLTQGHLTDVFPNEVIVVCIDKDSKEIENHPEYSPETNVTPEHLVSIYYTSGSTGKPKGVANIHRGWVNRMNWMQRKYQLKETETVLQKTTLTFDDAAVEFFWPLMVGGRIAMLEPELHKDPQAILNAAINYEVAVLQFVPSMLTAFLDSVDQKDQIKLTSLRHVISSGEALHPEVVKMFFERIGCNLYNQWGATEVSIDSTAHVCSLSEANQEVTVPVGRPIDNNQVYILDKHLQPVPIGVAGDLYLSGVGLARGYLNDSKRTNEAFISNPFVSNTLMYKTGDKGYYRSDGAIVFLGRLDNQVKIRGIRIELGEIETVLMEHLAVREATVVAISNSVGEKRLVAYLVIKQENSPTRQELRSFLKEKLPEYMHPSAYVFLDSFPLTTSGKVDRKCLPVPDLSKIETEQKYVAPSNEEEILLVDIWKQVLGIEKIGIHDNFFELGGHSLLATQVISKIRKIFEVNIPVRAIFEKPTILELGKEIVEYIIQEIDQLTEEETNKLLKY